MMGQKQQPDYVSFISHEQLRATNPGTSHGKKIHSVMSLAPPSRTGKATVRTGQRPASEQEFNLTRGLKSGPASSILSSNEQQSNARLVTRQANRLSEQGTLYTVPSIRAASQPQ